MAKIVIDPGHGGIDSGATKNDVSHVDYHGALDGSERVVKGGSWDLLADKMTISTRGRSNPYEKDTKTGFRVVLPNKKR